MSEPTLADRVVELETRVAGLENLIADLVNNGRIVVTVAGQGDGEAQAREVEREQERPSPAWGRD